MRIQEIFTENYYKVYDLTSDYVGELILSIFNQMDIIKILEVQYCSEVNIIEKLDLHEQSALPLRWMLMFLCNKNYLSYEEKEGKHYFKLNKPIKLRNPEEIADRILAIDEMIIYSNRLLKNIRDEYPSFLLGKKTGIEILFSNEKAKLWRDYFSNNHKGYAVHNYFGACVMFKSFPLEGDIKILEVGSGTGSGTVALLNCLKKENLLLRVQEYILSDISPIFLRESNRLIMKEIADFDRILLRKIDFNRSIEEQKIAPESIDIVYGVNALHVANDLIFTLKEIKNVLRKNGKLVISECIRNNEIGTPQPEFIFNLLDSYRNVKTDPTLRKTVGFLTPHNWRILLEEVGFNDIEIILNTDFDRGTRYLPIGAVIKGQKD